MRRELSMSTNSGSDRGAVRGLVGVVHLPPVPGDPLHRGEGGFSAVEQRALADAGALAAGGVDALLLENFGSRPFPRGTADQPTPPHQVALLALLARTCAERFGLPVGVNCLRNDAAAALGIAAAVGADFVRVNVHTGAYVTDQGLLQGQAHHSLRYRRSLGAERVAILADVLVKHAAPLMPLDPRQATRDCLERGLADGVIVTGPATGEPVSRELLRQVARAAEKRPVFIGSGLNPGRAADLAPLCDGAIVGTWLKHGGRVENPVDEARVRRLAEAVAGRWGRGSAGAGGSTPG
jgi:membrane complex biogenesis BtpA family protein